MNSPAPPSSRDIARAAVRARLAEVAFELFWRHGFDEVTVNDVAAAAGVSRSTFLRHFATKEEAVLDAFEHQGTQIAEALATRPEGEDNWSALRRAVGALTTSYAMDATAAQQMAQVVQSSPALRAGRREQHARWARRLADVLLVRSSSNQTSPLQAQALAAAAMGCLSACVEGWVASEGRQDIRGLIDEAFSALALASH